MSSCLRKESAKERPSRTADLGFEDHVPHDAVARSLGHDVERLEDGDTCLHKRAQSVSESCEGDFVDQRTEYGWPQLERIPLMAPAVGLDPTPEQTRRPR